MGEMKMAKTKFETKNEVSLAIEQTFQFFFFSILKLLKTQ